MGCLSYKYSTMTWLVLTGTLGVLTGLVAYYSLKVEPFRLKVLKGVLLHPDLPKEWDGLKVLHVSDLHFLRPDPPILSQLINVLDQEFDLVFMTGDYIEKDSGIEAVIGLINAIRSRYGIFAVPGNHDYHRYNYWSLIASQCITPWLNKARHLFDRMSASGVNLLVNSSVNVGIMGRSLRIIGVDDPVTYRDNIKRALKGSKPADFNVLLSHLPDIIEKIDNQTAQLVFSAHTHGGQIRLPVIGELATHSRLRRGYSTGLMQAKNTVIHVSRGIGVSGILPVRLLSPPEIGIFTLKRGKGYYRLAKAKRFYKTRNFY